MKDKDYKIPQVGELWHDKDHTECEKCSYRSVVVENVKDTIRIVY